MATEKDKETSHRAGTTSAAQHQSQSAKEPERHPAQPPPATPGRAQPDQQPHASDEEKKPEEKVVDKAEVKALFEAGTRLRKKGDPPEKWIAAVRLHNTLCLAQPLDEELEKKVLGQELVLVAD